jgi:hypothetical protein
VRIVRFSYCVRNKPATAGAQGVSKCSDNSFFARLTLAGRQLPISRVVSMGRRNISSKSIWRELNS